MRFEFAKLGIDVNFKYDYAIRRMKDYQSEFGGTHIQVNIERDDDIILPEGEIFPVQSLMNWMRLSDGTFAAFRYVPSHDKIIMLITWDKTATHINIRLSEVEHLGGYPYDMREFSSLGDALRAVFPFHNRTSLHSSSLCYNGEGIAFSAPSGTGKSTHVSLWQKVYSGCEIINDDSPIVYCDGDTYKIYGNPWAGKTEIQSNISATLKAIVCLARGRENSIEKITPKYSMPFLLTQTRPSSLAERETRRITLLADILENVDTYLLKCTPDEQAVILCKEKIWQE